MEKIISGIREFQTHDFPEQREFFERLAAKQQKPVALFITCSDSRINPNLITQTEPGELFILRNAGNIVPPHGATSTGEEATIEFALTGLGVRDIVVCGHSHCGAVSALLAPYTIRESMPAMSGWLRHAEATRRIVQEKYRDLDEQQLRSIATQENVLVQLKNLQTLPAVAAWLASGELKLHGWVYKIETGQVFAFDAEREQFVPLAEQPPAPIPSSTRLAAAYDI